MENIEKDQTKLNLVTIPTEYGNRTINLNALSELFSFDNEKDNPKKISEHVIEVMDFVIGYTQISTDIMQVQHIYHILTLLRDVFKKMHWEEESNS